MIWLNPLAGAEDYEPLTQGMRAAAPYIDDLLPVHNLAALIDLARYLNGLQRKLAGPQAGGSAASRVGGDCCLSRARPALVAPGRQSLLPTSHVGPRDRVGGGSEIASLPKGQWFALVPCRGGSRTAPTSIGD